MATLKNLELRKLPTGTLYNVVDILEINDDWKKVMAFIPKNPQSDLFEPKYNSEHIRIIEDHAKANSRKCSEVLFDEWGTSGRIRPTLHTLKDIVLKAKIYRAADEIASLLQEPPPRRPSIGPEAPITTNVTFLLNNESMEQKLNEMDSIKNEDFIPTDKQMTSHNQAICNRTTKEMKSQSDTAQSFNIPKLSEILTESSLPGLQSKPTEMTEIPTTDNSSDTPNPYQMSLPNVVFSQHIDTAILDDENLIHFQYEVLQTITNSFAEKAVSVPGGLAGKIGSGGFGDVFAGIHPRYGALAIKKVNNKVISDHRSELAMKLFNAEVKFLARFRHENIVPLLGFSKDGPSLCIVCQFIEGGSLEHNLQAKILNEVQRLKIMRGTAEGLKYLHKSEKPADPEDLLHEVFPTNVPKPDKPTKNYFVHGDVKSANILLTRDCIPKLCDFGLAKQSDSTIIMTHPLGTQGYMAVEGFYGTISQKIDIYAYGVVLLELLTGLRAMWAVSKTETLCLKNYVQEKCKNDNIECVLDPSVKNWTVSKAQDIYMLAKSCVEFERKSRPTIEEICDILDRTIYY